MGREFELKYAATPAQQQAIYGQFDNWTEMNMQTTYYDTQDHALSAKKCTLRCRLENGISVCTLKTPGSGLGRGEWDVIGPWSSENVEKLFTAAAEQMISFANLIAVCGARFTRYAKVVKLPECTVEIALDRGVLMGGNREIPLCEVEVELKSGSEVAAAAWAEQLAGHYGMQPERNSKFRRAALLAKGE